MVAVQYNHMPSTSDKITHFYSMSKKHLFTCESIMPASVKRQRLSLKKRKVGLLVYAAMEVKTCVSHTKKSLRPLARTKFRELLLLKRVVTSAYTTAPNSSSNV